MIISIILNIIYMNSIILQYCGEIHTFKTEPYETIQDSYERAWYILKNITKYPIKMLYSLSIIKINEKKGMIYDI